jgi:hypothetical protein
MHRQPTPEAVSQSLPAATPELASNECHRPPDTSALTTSGRLGVLAVCILLAGAFATGLLVWPNSRSEVQPAASQQVDSISTSVFQPVAKAEVDLAIRSLIMSDAQKQRVRTALDEGRLRIAWTNLFDSEVEDGDWVRVTAGGFSQDVRLFKDPLRVAVPYMPGAPILITGLIDGDGHGITVGVHSGTSMFALKPLVKGESIQVTSP